MGNFSRDPETYLRDSLDKGYVGARIEQGVPVLDRDLNLLGDLPLAMLRTLTAEFIGDGVRVDSDAFKIQEIEEIPPAVRPANDFLIMGPGTLLHGGTQVRIPEPIRYSAQSTVPLTTPSAGRTDYVYLDVTQELVEVDHVADGDLANRSDVGERTSVRMQTVWEVRVAEGATAFPEDGSGHTYVPLAILNRPAGAAQIVNAHIADERQEITQLRQVGETSLAELQRDVAQLQEDLGRINARLNRGIEPATRLAHDGPRTMTISLTAPAQLVMVFGQVNGIIGAHPFRLDLNAAAAKVGADVQQRGVQLHWRAGATEPAAPPVRHNTKLFVAKGEPRDSAEDASIVVTSWSEASIRLTLALGLGAADELEATIHCVVI